jgi:hypothetical protein
MEGIAMLSSRHGIGILLGLTCALSGSAGGQVVPSGGGSAAANVDDVIISNTPARLTYIFGGDNATTIEFTQFTGTYTAPLDGKITLLVNDPTVPLPAPTGYIGVSVRDALLLATTWNPPNNIMPDPLVVHLDPGMRSIGWYQPRTGKVFFTLYLVNGCFQAPATMPLHVQGRLTRQRLTVTGCNMYVADDVLCISFGGRRYLAPLDIRRICTARHPPRTCCSPSR